MCKPIYLAEFILIFDIVVNNAKIKGTYKDFFDDILYF